MALICIVFIRKIWIVLETTYIYVEVDHWYHDGLYCCHALIYFN